MQIKLQVERLYKKNVTNFDSCHIGVIEAAIKATVDMALHCSGCGGEFTSDVRSEGRFVKRSCFGHLRAREF